MFFKKAIATAAVFLATTTSAAMACEAPVPVSAFDRAAAEKPWCLADYEETGRHDCSRGEFNDYLDDVDSYYRALKAHLKASKRYAKDVRRFARCEARVIEADMPPNGRYVSPLRDSRDFDRPRRSYRDRYYHDTRYYDDRYDDGYGRGEVRNCVGRDGRYYRAYRCDTDAVVCNGKLYWDENNQRFICKTNPIRIKPTPVWGKVESHKVRY